MDRYRGRSPSSRDRPPIRHRDDHPDVEYFGQGESYRPGGSTGEGPYRPPHRERAAEQWNTDRRDDRRRDDIDSYIPNTSARAQTAPSRSPNGFNKRSRSPYGRAKELFPERPRSPPRRYSPRRSERERSPIRRRSRSPQHQRLGTPDSKRPRDLSSEGRRSPKRGRMSSPRSRYDRPRSPPRRPYSPTRDGNRSAYRANSRSPPRGGNKPAYTDDNWRRRSPSPRASGPASSDTSRRSSPPMHPDRSSLGGSAPRSPAHPTAYRTRSPLPHGDNLTMMGSGGAVVPPSGPASQKSIHERAPPTGPSRPYTSSAPANMATSGTPPTGPASQNPISAHSRGGMNLAPPTHPRAVGPSRYGSMQRDYPSPPLRSRGSLTYRAPGVRPLSYQDSGPPSGPRASTFAPSRGDHAPTRGSYGQYGRGDSSYTTTFRASNNATSATYPRSQRFNLTPTNTTQTYMGTLEKIVPGGKRLPSGLNADAERRLQALSVDAEKLRLMIQEKQKAKREAVNEWEVRQRESARESLRSELAEEALTKLMDSEDISGGAAF